MASKGGSRRCGWGRRLGQRRRRRLGGRARVESSAINARIEAPKTPREWGVGENVPFPLGDGSKERTVPLP